MKVLVLNGPNLNMLGQRNKELYGSKTLNEIKEMMKKYIDWEFDFFQSNYEGALIDQIQQALNYDAIIINPGGLAHTSICLRDALEIYPNKKIEVHLSDVDNREDFRKIDFLKDVVDARICGYQEKSYILAINYLKLYI